MRSPLADCLADPTGAARTQLLHDLRNPYYIGDQPGGTQVSGWLEQAIAEGRAALNSLRSSTTLKNDLGPALRRAAESGFVPGGMTVSVSVIGDARELHPIVRDELYRIGNEAIQNAKAHSHGSRLANRVARQGLIEHCTSQGPARSLVHGGPQV